MIRIVSKSEKKAGQIRDALRIMAWEQFKIDGQISGDKAFDAYESFKQEWNDHDVHNLDYAELIEFCSKLEYSEEELLKYRSAYYERKSRFNKAENGYQVEEVEDAPSKVIPF